MVARTKLTMPAGTDGRLQPGEDLIDRAGLGPGDVVNVPVEETQPPISAPDQRHPAEGVDLAALPRWTLDELFEQHRIDEPVDVEEAIGRGEADSAREFIEKRDEFRRRAG